MDDIRGSLSKMKKKFKRRLGLTGRKRRPDGTGVNPGGEETDSTSSFPQPEPHVVAGKSYDREGERSDAAGERVFSTGSPQPDGTESVLVRGGDVGQEGEGGDVDGGEANQIHSHQHPDVEVVVGSGHGGELEGVHPSPSTPSILHGGKPNSA